MKTLLSGQFWDKLGAQKILLIATLAQRERDGDAGVGDPAQARVRVAGRGRHDEGDDEGVVDGAVEVQLQLEVVVDDGDALRQQVERVGDVGTAGRVLAECESMAFFGPQNSPEPPPKPSTSRSISHLSTFSSPPFLKKANFDP